jgi:hypothetical protein
MRTFGLICILYVTVLSCKYQDERPLVEYSDEIQSLISNDKKRTYLEAIFKEDQEVRNSQGEYDIVLKYGRDSKEFENRIKIMKETDYQNLKKIETYLDQWGHPSKKDLGEIAALTPWVVVHHASDYEPRVSNFKYMYRGFKNGDMDEGSFSMYLARMYQIKYGERLDMGGPYQEKDKINRLIKKLDLITKN